ncbi:MAG: glycosyltransferase family 4 protein [Saprospiraceae bacterium]|nr:glycosyltransferase family 4 protein [Saprospiraceae bacterium]
MKILFILESFHPNIGGVETLFKSLIEELSAKGHQIIVITNRPGSKVPSFEVLPNVEIRRYRFFSRYLFTLLAFFPAWYHARKCDFIQTTSYNAGLPAFFAGLLSGKKTYITFHEYWGDLWFKLPFFGKFSLWMHFLFEKLLVKIPFYRFIAVSEFTKQSLTNAGVDPSKIIRIYNGIDYEDWTNKTDLEGQDVKDHYQFIYFGRLGISKGLEVLLKATSILQSELFRFRLVLVVSTTPDSLLSEIKSMIDEYDLHSCVRIFHHLSKHELIEKITQSDAVVIPSYSEGFCYAAVESVALGMPIISSGRGALPEVVSGRFITLDQLGATELYQAMKKSMMHDWCQKEIKKFALKDTVDQYIDLYQKTSQLR